MKRQEVTKQWKILIISSFLIGLKKQIFRTFFENVAKGTLNNRLLDFYLIPRQQVITKIINTQTWIIGRKGNQKIDYYNKFKKSYLGLKIDTYYKLKKIK